MGENIIVKTRLVTSFKLYKYGVGADGITPTEGDVEIGICTTINPSERRDIYENFVIGNDPPDVPFELVPGVVRGKTIACSAISLYSKNILEAFGTGTLDSLVDQRAPFVVREEIKDPTGTTALKVRLYTGCYIQEYASTRDMAGGDIRVLETATIAYKQVK